MSGRQIWRWALLLNFTVWLLIAFAFHMARAQFSSGALVVQTCGTLPQAYAAGSTRSVTVDTNGNLCQ